MLTQRMKRLVRRMKKRKTRLKRLKMCLPRKTDLRRKSSKRAEVTRKKNPRRRVREDANQKHEGCKFTLIKILITLYNHISLMIIFT